MKRIILGIMLIILSTNMLTLAFDAKLVSAEPPTIYVDDDNTTGPWDGTPEHPYRNITSGIENAAIGYVIFVRNGTYHEKVEIDKDNLTLIGENKASTIIDGDGTRSYGIYLSFRRGVTVKNFKVVRSTQSGIVLQSSTDNNLINNIVSYNKKGISLVQYGQPFSSDNNVIENTISNNIAAGLYLNLAQNNNFSHNNFINNTVQVEVYDTSYANTWDDGYPSGGNYWSDYTGVDVKSGPGQDQPGSDGIGDTPYVIDSKNNDTYPLTNPYPLRGLAWPMFHNNLRHTGYSESMAPDTNATLWNYTTRGRVHSSPAVAYGLVYIGSFDHQVYALNATTGALVWNYTTGSGVYSSPAIAYGLVFIGSGDKKIYALDATTGEHIWNYATESPISSSPAVAYGKVYIGSGNKLYCLDATTGKHLWNYPIDLLVASSPAVANGVVYFSYANTADDTGGVYALNATTGKKIWDTIRIGKVEYSSPAVAYGMVFVGSWDKKVYAFNSATGALVWNYTTNGMIESSPAVAYGRVFIGSDDYNIYCLNASAVSMSPEDRKLWNCPTGGSVDSSPAVAYGMVFIGSNDNKTYALDAITGKHIWNYTSGGPVSSSPAVAHNILFVGSYDNNTYAFCTHNIVITGVKSFKNVVCQNFTTEINVNVTNQFPFDEVFNLTLKANETIIQTKKVALTSLNSTTITFTWNTTGFDIGNYTISAVADAVANESDISDNTSIDGIVSVRLPIYDIAVTDVTPYKNITGTNGDWRWTSETNRLRINVTVANFGDFEEEDVQVTVYANATVVNQTTILNLAPHSSIVVSLLWNTTDFVKGNYTTIWAYARPVPLETHTADNNRTDDWVFVSIVGDINGDREVDLRDTFRVDLAYGSFVGTPRYKPNLDINGDGRIDLKDVFITDLNYGKTW